MEREHLIYRIIEYGKKNEQFAKRSLFTDLNLSDHDQFYVDKTLIADETGIGLQTNHVLILVNRSSSNERLDWQYRITPNAIFQYDDHVEIIEARKAATSARRLSWIAIIITLIIGIIQSYLGYLQVMR